MGSSSSLHSEVCNIPGFLFGDATAKFLGEATKRTVAVANLQNFNITEYFAKLIIPGIVYIVHVILAEGAIALSVTLSGDALFAS